MRQKKQRDRPFLLGVDIGGTKCALVLGDEKMRVYDRIVFPTRPQRGWKRILQQLFQTIDKITLGNGLKLSAIRKAGISCGGPLDSRKGLILSPPNLPGWNRVPIVRLLQKKLKCPVRLENDANACAVAEWKFGAGRGCQDMVFLTFGTGLGAGLILDGRLYRGANDLAGEAGHIRLAEEGPMGYGKKGTFEAFCSGGGIARMGKKTGSRTAKEVFEAAERGDQASRKILHSSAHYLGMGLSLLIDLLNPERIILGGVYMRNEKIFKEEAMRVIRREALARSRSVCKILRSGLGERIGDLSSLCVALMEG